MLVRRDGESLNVLLNRLDKAIDLAWSNDAFVDEVNDGESDLLYLLRRSRVKRGLETTLTVDTVARHLLNDSGVIAALSGAECRLLRVFLDHPQKVRSRDQLPSLTQGRNAELF